MSGNAGVLNIQLRVDDKGTVKVRQFGNEAEKAGNKTEKGFKSSGKTINDFNQKMSKSLNLLMSITGIAGGLMILKTIFSDMVRLAGSFLMTAEGFEAMEVQLDTLTKGRGTETLDKLNKWALDMPVNTAKAVDSFRLMMAMGLNPTIKKLETLTDVSSIFGDDVLNRLALQLGQAAAKGKIMAQDLNIMAEAGINARKYLSDAYGKTVEQIQNSSIDIKHILNTIFEGMEKDFGGSAKKMMGSWRGLKTVAQSYFVEIKREVMSAGIFEEMKGALAGFNAEMKIWLEANRELIQQKVPEYLQDFKEAVQVIKSLGLAAVETIQQIQKLQAVSSWIDKTAEKTGGFAKFIKTLKMFSGVPFSPDKMWGAAKDSGFTEYFYDLARAIDLAHQGLISFSEIPESPSRIHDLVESFDMDPLLYKQKQAEKITNELIVLRENLAKASALDKDSWFYTKADQAWLSHLEAAIISKTEELKTINKTIADAVPLITTEVPNQDAHVKEWERQQEITAEKVREAQEKATEKYNAFILSTMDKTTQEYKDKWVAAEVAKWAEMEGVSTEQLKTIEAKKVELVNKYDVSQKEALLKQFEEAHLKSTTNTYDYELKMIEKTRQAFEKAGFDEVKIAEWVAAEKKRIAEGRKADEEKKYNESLRGWAKFEQLAAESNARILKIITDKQEKSKSAFSWMFDKDIWTSINKQRGDKNTSKALSKTFFQGMAIDAKDAFQSELGGFFTDALRQDLDSGREYFQSFTNSLQGIWGNAMSKMMMTPAMWTAGNFTTMGIAGVALGGIGALLDRKSKKRAEDKEKAQSRDRLNEQMVDNIAQLELSEIGYEVYQTTKELAAMSKEAIRTGADLEKLNKLRELETDRLKEGAAAYYEKSMAEAAEPFDTVLDKYKNWTTGREQADWNISDWQSEVDRLGEQFATLNSNDAEYFAVAEQQLDAIMTLVDFAEQQLAAYESTQKSLDAQIWDLTGGDPLGAVDKKAYQDKYDALLIKAKTLDLEAIADFQRFVPEYLQTMDAGGDDHAVTANTIATDLGQLAFDIEDPMIALREAIDKNTTVVGTDSVNALNRLVSTLMLDRQEAIRDTFIDNVNDFLTGARDLFSLKELRFHTDLGGFGDNAGGVTSSEQRLMDAVEATRAQKAIWEKLLLSIPEGVLSETQTAKIDNISGYYDNIPDAGNYNPYIRNWQEANKEKNDWVGTLGSHLWELGSAEDFEKWNLDLESQLLNTLNGQSTTTTDSSDTSQNNTVSSEEIGKSVAKALAPLLTSGSSSEKQPIQIVVDGKVFADIIVGQAEGGHEELIQLIEG